MATMNKTASGIARTFAFFGFAVAYAPILCRLRRF